MAVAGIALLVYLLTLLPGVGVYGDTVKFQFVGKVLGVPHPPGYPLYVVLNALFVRAVPFGSLAYRANLFSAVLAAAATAAVFRLLRGLGTRRLIAGSASLVFSFMPTLWSHAVMAEVYALFLLLSTLVLHLLLTWDRRGDERFLLAGLVLYALSFGSHLLAITMLPAVAWLTLTRWRTVVTARNLVVVFVGIAMGAAQYLYVVVRADAPFAEGGAHSLQQFVDVVTAKQFRGHLFSIPWREVLTDRVEMFVRLASDELSVVLAFTALGLAVSILSGRARIFLVLIGLVDVAYALNYGVDDVAVFFVPAYFVAVVLAATGAERVAAVLPAVGRVVMLVAVAAAPAWMLMRNWSSVDQSDNVAFDRRMKRFVTGVPAGAHLVATSYVESQAMFYYLLGDGFAERRALTGGHAVPPTELAQFLRSPAAPGSGTPAPLVYSASPLDSTALRAVGLDIIEEAGPKYRILVRQG